MARQSMTTIECMSYIVIVPTTNKNHALHTTNYKADIILI